MKMHVDYESTIFCLLRKQSFAASAHNLIIIEHIIFLFEVFQSKFAETVKTLEVECPEFEFNQFNLGYDLNG